MKRWSAVMSGRSPSDLLVQRHRLRRVIDLPFDCELVFSAERPVNTIPTMSIAFGQKGRCEMKLFESSDGRNVLGGPVSSSQVSTCRPHAPISPSAQPVNVQSEFPFLDPAERCVSTVSPRMGWKCTSNCSGRETGGDHLWVCKRASPRTTGVLRRISGRRSTVRARIAGASLTADGLELYFVQPARRYGATDIYVTRRATRNSPWGSPDQLGAEGERIVRRSMAQLVSSDGLELYFSRTARAAMASPISTSANVRRPRTLGATR